MNETGDKVTTGAAMGDVEPNAWMESDGDKTADSGATKPRYNLVVIPVIPKPLAILCLVLNIILPGSGTIVSAFSVFCFYHKKETIQGMVIICTSNIAVGLCQLISVMFIFIGWFWSIIWGCALVGYASYYKRDKRLSLPIVIQPLEMSKSPPASSTKNDSVI